jgi:dTMP kinase
VRGIYEFAAQPDLVFFFKAPLETSLGRILDGRPQLKYFEAGMDMNFSSDMYESFRLFQGMQLEQYLAMSTEFDFLIVDAKGKVEEQQSVLRQLISEHINLDTYKKD